MPSFGLYPGHGVGFLRLGAGLYDVLTVLKADQKTYPRLHISYDTKTPLTTPVVVELPDNGLRLRFDGPEQRVRLIEVLSLDKDQFTHKNEPIINATDQTGGPNKLMYRRVYQLFGASYPGEYMPPANGSRTGTYVVSYPGVALSFPLATSLWSPQVDHAKMLAESGSSVSSIAIFEGKSWAEARKDLFTRRPALPRSLLPMIRQKEGHPDEVEDVTVQGLNVLQFARRSSPPVKIRLGETTTQDLVNDFGRPDSIFKRPNDDALDATIRRPSRMTRRRSSTVVPRSFGSTPSSISSTTTDTYDADFEEDDGIDGPDVVRHEEQYYCYFQHGFDALVGPASDGGAIQSCTQPVVTRVILHGNVPGSFEFNRHRRSRWGLEHVTGKSIITSESRFPEVHDQLIGHFKDQWPERDMREGMVIVRDWAAGDSPSGSAILIGEGAESEEEEAWGKKDGEQWLKNTQLYKFPGMMFEVMHNGAISALTVYWYGGGGA